ncbi:MAG TPA: protein kinase [Gemmatimonas sp.]|nr:protein kinase [Gemmatimonas sp.]
MTSNLDEVRQALETDYDVIRLLGRGGMATVYLATDKRTGQQVAVKVLEPDLAGSVGHDRFLREIRIASTLQHPGILTVQDSGNANGMLYYVMKYVDGESLRERMDRELQMPIDEVIRIVTEVATALHVAHGQGFIHRDIKPDNIMLADGRALLMDFGISRAIDQAGTDRLTETGLAVGTPAYMSPEQWAGGERVDGRADLYALGCVTYEMLIGEPPFNGPTAQVILARHLSAEVPSLCLARTTIDPAIEDAVQRAMAKVPSDRFATAEAFAHALALRAPEGSGTRRASTDAKRTASTPSPVTPILWYRRRATMFAVIMLLVLAIGGVAARKFMSGDRVADRSRLVVLPFRNVGAAEDEYFADGVTEEITSRLSSVSSIGVIARTSATQYRNSDKSVKQIGEELGVGYLIEGSVRWDRLAVGKPGVKIAIRLIRVSDGTQMWSTDLTVELAAVFDVQAMVAERVIEALDRVLIAPERARLVARPTEDMTAYDFYLRGNAYYNKSWERADVDSAIVMYEQATNQDSTFALAWAQLGKTHAWKHRLGFDETPERLALARAAIAKANRFGPDLAETHIAQGLYLYWGEWKYEEAVTSLSKARAIQPSNAWVYLQLGNIRRRQGQWVQALKEYEKAAEFDPRFHIVWFNIGHLKLHIRQYDQAGTYLDRVLTLQPTFLDAYLLRQGLIVARTGDRALARRAHDSTLKVVPAERWRLLPGQWLTGPMRTIYPSAAERLTLIRPGNYGLDSSLALLARAEALTELGAAAAAKATVDSAGRSLRAQVARSPQVAWLAGALAVAEALAGNKNEAIALAKRAESLQNDALDGPNWIINEAHVQLLVGNRSEAMDALELALRIPSGLSVSHLDLDPTWDPLRNDPRFKQIRAKGSPPPPTK